MSLFKVREFWSFDLDQLAAQCATSASCTASADKSNSGTSEEAANYSESRETFSRPRVNSMENNEGDFIVQQGKFHSIGNVDVFVCANLDGLICVVKIPEKQQLKTIGSPDEKNGHRSSKSNSSRHKERVPDERQLLLLKDLGFPIVDIKCGYFTSALKQSIVVLSLKHLSVYQVKRQQVDLLSADQVDSTQIAAVTDEHLLAYRLELHHRIDLLPDELAANVVILNNHAESSLVGAPSSRASHSARLGKDSEPSVDKVSSKHGRRAQTSVQQLNLPQRDGIVVQYTNQFLFSLLDSKRVVGHFCLAEHGQTSDQGEPADPESRMQLLGQFVGLMPMVHLHETGAQSLVITLSDHSLHSLPLAKLSQLAKQNVMKRVAQDLLTNRREVEASPSSISQESAKKDRPESRVDLDLASVAQWSLEMPLMPIQLSAVRKSCPESSTQEVEDSSHLIIMTRHTLDLISSSGEKIWSQRFETPLTCLHCYETERAPNKDLHETKILSLVCTDCMGDDKSNLLVIEDDRIAWSAMLQAKPIGIWRSSIGHISGIISYLDIRTNRLSACYLGTNTDSQEDEFDLPNGDSLVSQLEFMNKSVFDIEGVQKSNDSHDDGGLVKKKLRVNVNLEASKTRPNMSIECRISLLPQHGTLSVLQNIQVRLEFDDLIAFEYNLGQESQCRSDRHPQIQLGSCWPDRREPLLVTGRFSLLSSNPRSDESSDLVDDSTQQVQSDFKSLLPKSLKVDVYLRYDEAILGPLIQEESFLLPLSMLGSLVHIDYTIGADQSLDDVQSNLSHYKRRSEGYSTTHTDSSDADSSPYFMSDLFTRVHGDVIGLMDEIIESDLVCRGLNVESNSHQSGRSKDHNSSTYETINLLAESLNCCIKFRSSSSIVRQTSEEQVPPVMISIALRVPSGCHLMEGVAKDESDQHSAVVWLHICDLSATHSAIPHEIIRQHMREWKAFNLDTGRSKHPADSSSCPVFFSIESDYSTPVLFVQDHLIRRLQQRSLTQSGHKMKLYPLSEAMQDAVEINHLELMKLDNFVAISNNLHECLLSAHKRYEELVESLESLKTNLNKEYCKFHVCSMALLTMAKTLAQLPEDVNQRFTRTVQLTLQYNLKLMHILSELNRLKRLDYLYSKMPEIENILLEREDKTHYYWTKTSQIIA